MDKKAILRSITFGQRVAEEETDALATYFVETDHWERLYRGDIDVIYGQKGSGKSALYALLISKSNEFFDRNIILVAAENPRGAPAFRDLVTDPPANEREFVGLRQLINELFVLAQRIFWKHRFFLKLKFRQQLNLTGRIASFFR